MSFSINTVTSDGVETQFPISFTNGIYNRDNVKVFVEDDLDGGGAQLERTFTWINDGIIELDVAAPNGKAITIQRIMNKDEPDVNYVDGAILDESNLNQSLDQLLAIQHEILDGVGIDRFNQDVDMGGYRLTNLGQGIDETDGVTLAQVKSILSTVEAGSAIRITEEQLGTAAVSSIFTLSLGTYVLGSGNLEVRRNGLPQNSSSYTELTPTTIRIDDQFNLSDVFTFLIYVPA